MVGWARKQQYVDRLGSAVACCKHVVRHGAVALTGQPTYVSSTFIRLLDIACSATFWLIKERPSLR